ncbi:uncharacterized protein LOC130997144 [Salvia miltiorrhiza]|uniref:uncharacterized protein LOC130997144 n=1 Tax=Salvia miltiorrhiza TaxID=226208 RepID=UPI0025AC7005|nr:uncharacterized protein LOC130997144 [Salvia miltiorrhiza]
MSGGEGGKWFRDNMEVKIGERDGFLFWHHCWAGNFKLSELFPRLFHLSNNKGGAISSMGTWFEGEWRWDLKWNRELRQRELDQVQQLTSSTCNVRLTAGSKDSWCWKASKNGVFSVQSAYYALGLESRSMEERRVENEMALIWKASAKAVITAWKVLRGRFPTFDNLRRRQVNFQSGNLCVLCNSCEESINHLFFSCHKTDAIWKDIISWLGKQTASQTQAKAHFNAFINLGNKDDVKLLLSVWICTIWCFWRKRNECIFKQGMWNRERIFSEIKSILWGWKMAFNLVTPYSEFRRWFSAEALIT